MNLLTLKNKVNMKKILGLLMLFVSLHVFAETTSVDVQEEKTVDVRLKKGTVTKWIHSPDKIISYKFDNEHKAKVGDSVRHRTLTPCSLAIPLLKYSHRTDT